MMSKKFNILAGIALALMMGLSATVQAGPGSASKFKKEAQALYQVNESYFEERQASDWVAIYHRQHPRFRRNIPFIQFVNLEGRVAFKDVDRPEAHLSGASMDPEDQKTKLYQKRDLLGFPTTRPYKIFPNPWISIKSHRIKKISISEDHRFAKVETDYDLREQLDPTIFRVIMVIDRVETLTDYWEKVDGRWVVPLMINKLSLSGHKMIYFFTPRNREDFETMNFVDIDPARLEIQRP